MTARRKNAHCSYCGQGYAPDLAWPRQCGGCESISYLNPLPVGIVLLPVDDGLLVVRRTIEPAFGQLALPGGFLDVHETWQEGCARELREETGVHVEANEIRLFRAYSSSREGLLLLFGLAAARAAADLPPFTANSEASEMLVVGAGAQLAFPLHTRVAQEFFADRR